MKKAIILSSLVSILLSGCLTAQAMTAEKEAELRRAELRSKPPLERLTTDFDDIKNTTRYKQSYFTHYKVSSKTHQIELFCSPYLKSRQKMATSATLLSAP